MRSIIQRPEHKVRVQRLRHGSKVQRLGPKTKKKFESWCWDIKSGYSGSVTKYEFRGLDIKSGSRDMDIMSVSRHRDIKSYSRYSGLAGIKSVVPEART